jgi:hypothetical protein
MSVKFGTDKESTLNSKMHHSMMRGVIEQLEGAN